ncbi:MAG: radical SAM protein [Thermodesulfobacteria bacterium]|nr:radical SAM protein [Thermodesulfobacteriota bacterium]
MGECLSCGKSAVTISSKIGYCVSCLRRHWSELQPEIKKIHAQNRRLFGLPEEPPRAENGRSCRLCHHQCRIPEGHYGYCGVWRNEKGKLRGISPYEAHFSWYLDPLPTNCVADFVCPGGTGAGYPRFAHVPGPERGWHNLAVFYEACNFNCLYCQNWHFRLRPLGRRPVTSEFLWRDLNPTVSCICYFGGDPGPQAPHALFFSRKMREQAGDGILRICWETNGAEARAVIREMMKLSLESGGSVKIDLKAWSAPVHETLCGVSNQQTLKNFAFLSEMARKRPYPPSLVASTLLVPGYVDEEEIDHLARFLASLDRDIPWSFLGFYPNFYLDDLPTTSSRHAKMALEIARSHGLRNLHLGNRHLLSDAY